MYLYGTAKINKLQKVSAPGILQADNTSTAYSYKALLECPDPDASLPPVLDSHSLPRVSDSPMSILKMIINPTGELQHAQQLDATVQIQTVTACHR